MNKLYVILISLFCINIFSQDINSLKQQKADNLKAIDLANEMLQKTSLQKSQTINNLNILNAKIRMRNIIIESINREIEMLNVKLLNTNSEIINLENNIENLKALYAHSLNNFYKTRPKQNLILFIFSSNSFNQSYKRIKYFQQYLKYINYQKDLIVSSKNELYKTTVYLDNLINEKKSLLVSKTNEQIALNDEIAAQTTMLNELKKSEKSLLADIENRKKANNKLQKEIENFLKEEIKKKETKKTLPVTPDEKIYSDNFLKNKGILPWPVENGIITDEFGIHSHPVFKTIKIRNNGIDISAPPNSQVRSIFKGNVKSIVTVPGMNKVIIIRHGNYLTVYSNLSKIFVNIGDVVDIKQPIGEIFTDNNENFAVLNFQIWRENEMLNPSDWIKNNNETAKIK